MDFKVTSVDKHGVTSFGFGVSPITVYGIQKLVQLVIIKLLKTPGRDINSIETGGGLLGLIGSNIDPNDISEVIAIISPKIKKTETEIINEQMNVDLPPEEKLLKLNIVTVEQDSSNITGYNAIIEVINESEQGALASVGVSLLSGSK